MAGACHFYGNDIQITTFVGSQNASQVVSLNRSNQ